MKIMVLSDVQRKGGAGIAAHRLAVAMRDLGHDIVWATPHPDAASPFNTINCRDYPTTTRAARKIALTLRPGRRDEVESKAMSRRVIQAVQSHRPDVVHVHNLHGGNLSATLPAELSRMVPVVWTLHDMWAFTGTCAYSMTCRKFESACDAGCPLANVYPSSEPHRVAPQFLQRKEAFTKAGKIGFATPSHWLADEAVKGMLAEFPVRAIANCVELERYKPIDHDAARRALDLPTGRPVLVTSATPGDPRKGASVLYKALEELDRPNTILLQLGGGTPDNLPGKWDHRVLGSIQDARLMRLAYSAADAHVLPTLADNLPNTLLEASACGVPSIGSDVGGVGEAIIQGKTGWLFESGNVSTLAELIGKVIDGSKDETEARRRDCRTFAEKKFVPAKQAKRYIEYFNEMIQRRHLRKGITINQETTNIAREAA